MALRLTIALLACFGAISCSSAEPPGAVDAAVTFTYHYEWTTPDFQCMPDNSLSCTCAKNEGEACAQADECKGGCCTCDVGSRGFYASACENFKCTSVTRACELTLSKISSSYCH